MSIVGSEDIADFGISYDQLVGPTFTLFGACLTADTMALSDGTNVFLGEPLGMADLTGSVGWGCSYCN